MYHFEHLLIIITSWYWTNTNILKQVAKLNGFPTTQNTNLKIKHPSLEVIVKEKKGVLKGNKLETNATTSKTLGKFYSVGLVYMIFDWYQILD